MKKITLFLFFITLSIQAQNFPDPYCDIDPNNTTVEEITSVDFAGDNITNNNTSSILIDKTANEIDVTSGETYTLEIQGNTYGNFENDIVAFIDWNQNEILDDTDEIYEIGTIINSTGVDGVSANMPIAIPDNAQAGQTRVRITKTYRDDDSPAIVNPCAIEFNPFGQGNFPGYGQALDFSLNIETLSTASFDASALSVYPMPAQNILNVNYKSTINTLKIFNLLGQEAFAENVNANKFQLNISSFETGVYILKLYTDNSFHSLKFIKK